jgi:hypothetical protein
MSSLLISFQYEPLVTQRVKVSVAYEIVNYKKAPATAGANEAG